MSDDELQLNDKMGYQDDDEEEFQYSTTSEKKKDEKTNQFVRKQPS